MEFIVINEKDNVKVSLNNGHKYAVKPIKKGEKVIKYGFPIGIATGDIAEGEHVHSHNLKTALSGTDSYVYNPEFPKTEAGEYDNIAAYVRENGEIGIRNDIWIIPTVGCVNSIAARLAAQKIDYSWGVRCFNHPYGCSQLGDDHLRTQQILSGLIKHPNAGGVLVVGLGCENNNITELKKVLGDYDEKRIKFLNVQDCQDEMVQGVRLLEELAENAMSDKRSFVPFSRLKIGLKCGGSDGFSGITANALLGRFTDAFCAAGGTAVLTEVPEMFGAEQLLLNRCADENVFNKAVKMINDYKQYFISHNQPISENPSPGNKEGGITTLEEKSLGCVQKGGNAVITDVLDYGDAATKPGLNLLNGPGNDMVAVTNLTAAGCHIILFTTGRGTPLGAPVPTIKIASNSKLAGYKQDWIDIDAQLDGAFDSLDCTVWETANGRLTQNEINGFRDIAIFKDGVTL